MGGRVAAEKREEVLVAGKDVGGDEAGLLGLKVDTPAACQGEEETFGYYFG